MAKTGQARQQFKAGLLQDIISPRHHFPELALLTALLCLAPLTASAKATIRLINLDGQNEGLNDPTSVSPVGGNPGTTLGAQRLNALRYAANILEDILASDVTIEIGVRFDNQGGNAFSAALAAAGPNTFHYDFEGALASGVWHVQALANKVFGADLATANDCTQQNAPISSCYDIAAEFNSAIDNSFVLGGSDWYYGYDGPTAEATTTGNDFDLITVAVHEWLHGMGFISFVDPSSGRFVFSTEAQQDLPDRYSSFIRLQNGTPESFIDMTNNQRLAAMRSTGLLQWSGEEGNLYAASATDGVSNGRALLYAPDPIEVGASVSHIDTSFRPKQIMEPFYTHASHDLGIGAALLADIGWGNYTDLAANFAAGSNPVSNTTTSRYFIAISNRGDKVAPDAAFDYILPENTTFIGAQLESGSNTSITCSQTDNQVSCPVGSIESETTQVLAITVQHSGTGEITHAGDVHGNIVEARPDNNAISATTRIDTELQALSAEGGSAQLAATGDQIEIDGTNSTGNITQYNFVQVAGALAEVTELSPGIISFTVPAGTEDLLFRLTVTDGDGNTSADFAIVNINVRPTADAGSDQSVPVNGTATLDASASADTDGTLVSYQWRQVSGSSVSLSDDSAITPTFQTPERALELGFEVTVTDNEGATDTAQTTVSVIVPQRSSGNGGYLNWPTHITLMLLGLARLLLRNLKRNHSLRVN